MDLLSVLQFIPIGFFDDATVRSIGRAFDAACKELKDSGQPDVVHEVMIKRITAAAQRGERAHSVALALQASPNLPHIELLTKQMIKQQGNSPHPTWPLEGLLE